VVEVVNLELEVEVEELVIRGFVIFLLLLEVLIVSSSTFSSTILIFLKELVLVLVLEQNLVMDQPNCD